MVNVPRLWGILCVGWVSAFALYAILWLTLSPFYGSSPNSWLKIFVDPIQLITSGTIALVIWLSLIISTGGILLIAAGREELQNDKKNCTCHIDTLTTDTLYYKSSTREGSYS